VLQELYTEFEEKVFITCDSIGVEKYSRKIQVEKLAELVRPFDPSAGSGTSGSGESSSMTGITCAAAPIKNRDKLFGGRNSGLPAVLPR
jgi:hypothetical protein